jgi:outer membrane protein assembly factor BamE (lipoprotein component of BamABCDE complex)
MKIHASTVALARCGVGTLAAGGSLVLAGCTTAPEHRAAVRDDATGRLSVGTVQREIRVGMSGAEVIAALGPPNIVTTDAERREVWTYDRIATETVHSSSAGGISALILGIGSSIIGGMAPGVSQSAGAEVHTQRTLTIILRFDAERKVRDFSYHASQF